MKNLLAAALVMALAAGSVSAQTQAQAAAPAPTPVVVEETQSVEEAPRSGLSTGEKVAIGSGVGATVVIAVVAIAFMGVVFSALDN